MKEKTCTECKRLQEENRLLSERFERARELIEAGIKNQERMGRMIKAWRTIANEGRE